MKVGNKTNVELNPFIGALMSHSYSVRQVYPAVNH